MGGLTIALIRNKREHYRLSDTHYSASANETVQIFFGINLQEICTLIYKNNTEHFLKGQASPKVSERKQLTLI